MYIVLILLGLIAFCTVIVLGGGCILLILKWLAKKQVKKDRPADALQSIDTSIKDRLQ